ncbi:MAG: RDD family protein [Bacteroidota bacterium]
MYEKPIEIFEEQPIVYATFWERLAAGILDSIIIGVATFILEKLIDIDFSNLNSYWETNILSGVLTIFYSAYFYSSEKQATWGKQALNIKVTALNGERVSFINAVVRCIAEYLSFIILFIGYLMMLWDDKNQTLHDKIAGTVVVKSKL